MEDPLRSLPIEKWEEAQTAFKSIWPFGVSGYKVFETQREWLKRGFSNGCKIYCPYGDVWNGFVAINTKQEFYEVIIQCPKEDTSKLEEALRSTKLVDWKKNIIVPFAPQKIIRCVKALVQYINFEISEIPCCRFILDKSTTPYEISIPPGVIFDFVTKEHIDLVDGTWPHRYPTSKWFFEQLITMNAGYGLFKQNKLVSWVFISESGIITHLYVVEEERNNGYAQLIMKLVCNILLKDNKDTVAFCLQNNTKSYNLLTKIGLKHIDPVAWMFLTNKK